MIQQAATTTSLQQLKQRHRVALRSCIAAEDRRRAVPGGREHWDERFLWRCIAERCSLESRRVERKIKRLEAEA